MFGAIPMLNSEEAKNAKKDKGDAALKKRLDRIVPM
jgi:hypothetical protein